MANSLKFSVIYAEVKQSFTQNGFYSTSVSEKLGDILAYYMMPLFLNFRISANIVTLMSFSMTVVAAFITAFYATITAWEVGLILYALATVLDHIDGRVARETKTATFYGKFIDGLTGMANLVLIRMALVGVLYHSEGLSHLFWIGFTCLSFTPFYHFMYDRYSAYARWINEEKGLHLKPYIRHGSLIKPANIVVDVERIALVWSLFDFHNGLLVYFLVNIFLEVGYIFYHLYHAYKNMQVSNY